MQAKEDLAASWIPSFLSREESKSPVVGTWAPCTMWATVGYLRKMIQTPTISPCSILQWETGRLGRPGSRDLSGSAPGAWQQGDASPTWDQSSVFPA